MLSLMSRKLLLILLALIQYCLKYLSTSPAYSSSYNLKAIREPPSDGISRFQRYVTIESLPSTEQTFMGRGDSSLGSWIIPTSASSESAVRLFWSTNFGFRKDTIFTATPLSLAAFI